MQTATVHMTRHSMSLIIKEVQHKTTILYLYTSTKMVNLKMTDSIMCWQHEEQLKHSFLLKVVKLTKTALEIGLVVIYSSCIYVKPGTQQIHNVNEYICKPKDMYNNFHSIILNSS